MAISRQRVEQQLVELAEQSGEDRVATRVDRLSRKLYAHDLFVSVVAEDAEPLKGTAGTLLAVLPPADTEQDGIFLFYSDLEDRAEGTAVLTEVACAWTTAIRAGKLPRPPFQLQFAIFPSTDAKASYLAASRARDFLGRLDCDRLASSTEPACEPNALAVALTELSPKLFQEPHDTTELARIAAIGSLRFIADAD